MRSDKACDWSCRWARIPVRQAFVRHRDAPASPASFGRGAGPGSLPETPGRCAYLAGRSGKRAAGCSGRRGVIGLEVAAAATERGCSVTVVEAMPDVLAQ